MILFICPYSSATLLSKSEETYSNTNTGPVLATMYKELRTPAPTATLQLLLVWFVISLVPYKLGVYETRFGHFRGRNLDESRRA